MTTFVVDASVAAKWCVPTAGEDFVPAAVQLFESYVNGDIDLLVPDLFWAEMGNVLWKYVRRRKMPRDAADAGLRKVRALEIRSIPSSSLLQHALDIAITHDRSFYDSLYIALAIESSTEFITADDRLANALAARFPVKWLGAMLKMW